MYFNGKKLTKHLPFYSKSLANSKNVA